MPKRVQTVLLDVMGTLVYDPFYEVMPAHFGASLDELIAQKHPDAWLRFERGEMQEGEFLRSFFADGRRYDHAAFLTAVKDAYRLLDGVPALLDALAGLDLHALSNYPIWYRYIEERLHLSRWLKWSFVSCEMGVRKPEPEAYLIPARRLGVAPETCLFIDDRAPNVEAARALGMEAIRFESAAQTLAELRERELLR